MSGMRHRARRGFSLIELVIVVVIIAIIGAIAIPRMSRGAAGASDSALIADLTTLRNAIDLYATEHGGSYPAVATIVAQLTTFSNDTGGTAADNSDKAHPYGPYLRAVPPLPVGAKKSNSGIDADGSGGATGWVFDAATGKIKANCADTEVDAKGVKYNTY